MLAFLVYNWDIMPVLFVAVAFYLITQGRDRLASMSLALGFSCKFYPVMYLLPLLLRQRRISAWIEIIAVFAMTALAINIFFMLSNFDGWYHFFSFNSLRPPNPDSIWGVVYFWFPQLSASQINVLSLLLFATSSAILMWKPRDESTIKLCFILTLIFLLSNKVFSPQFILWLLPFLTLLPAGGIGRRLFYALELSNLAVLFIFLTWWSYEPWNDTRAYLCHSFVLIRHIILIYILVKVLKH